MLHQTITADPVADRDERTTSEAKARDAIADAAAHAADALPELLALGRGDKHFAIRARPYIDSIIHCLASGLEAALLASLEMERAGLPGARKGGEDALAIMVRDYMDQRAG